MIQRTVVRGASKVFDYLYDKWMGKEIVVSLHWGDMLLSLLLMELDNMELSLKTEAMDMEPEEMEELSEEECEPLWASLTLWGEFIELSETETCTAIVLPLEDPVGVTAEATTWNEVVVTSGQWTLQIRSAHEAIRGSLQDRLDEEFRKIMEDPLDD